MKKVTRFIPLVILILLFLIAHKFKLTEYLNYVTLKTYHLELTTWVNNNLLLAIIIFSITYILLVAASIPGATLGTIVGGFLFGNLSGTIIVLISATIGATCLYLAVKLALGDYISKRIGTRVKFMEKHFHENSFYYLLSLRLLPIAPFFLVNLAAGIFAVTFRNFFVATILGMIPATFVYVNMGSSLNTAFLKPGNQFEIAALLTPQIIFAFILLAIISIVPIVWKQIRRSKPHDN